MHSGLTVKWNAAQSLGQADSVEPRASQLFEHALRAANPTGIKRLFSQAATPLRSLMAAVEGVCVTHRYELGTRTVSLEKITGSLNKAADFDVDFRPLQRHSEYRWVKVATAMLRGIHLPPIELIQVGDTYYVKDGHHRISVARALSHMYLDAVVTVWAVEVEGADAA